jgi:hypothetical protein
MPTLADIYSAINTFKRKSSDFVQNPGTSLEQMLFAANENAREFNKKHALATDYTIAQARGRQPTPEQTQAEMGLRSTLAQAYNPAGIFVGPNSATFNKINAVKAQELEKAGKTAEEIWEQTGTFRGPDKQWRQEISDKTSKISDEVFNAIKSNQEFKGPTSQALTHPELYAAYPDTAKIPSGLFASRVPEGSYHAPTDSILAGGPGTGSQRSAMLHEIQHAVQQREGFAKGSSPNGPYPAGVRDQIIKDQYEQLKAATKYDPSNPYSSPNALTDEELLQMAIRNTDAMDGVGRMQAYRRSAGEAEARAVQKRRDLTNEERRAIFPLKSYDVPIKDLIFR